MRSNDFSQTRRPADRRRGRHDHDLGFGPGFGGGGPGRPRGRRRGGRGGDVRAATLLLLAEEPQHGYQLIQEIAERSDGTWTPSPGSIYPVLQQLEDEGLLSFERVDGRKTATLTPEGTTYVEEHRDELGTPWEAAQGDRSREMHEFAHNLKGFINAWKQVAQAGTPEQRVKANAVVDDARKAMYLILADAESGRP
ncbi:PadR family transcriptional regulator [Aeromicrobium fastidiosum]|uniref:PadR family transcriptional regulator n=1 Tax=Aeromicrobium fastidiosum TaxID=52699 RepID=UPI00202372C1|nr:PadR family transcriptional regulator [Aeromicrobium fastidiosum]MCL8253204.1 PadR family transcriptional regulator [Aeromicrobium fastidiosum]